MGLQFEDEIKTADEGSVQMVDRIRQPEDWPDIGFEHAATRKGRRALPSLRHKPQFSPLQCHRHGRDITQLMCHHACAKSDESYVKSYYEWLRFAYVVSL